MWTPTTRRQHGRDHLRYGSVLTDAEWELIAPHMPPPVRTGRPRDWPMREIMNAIFYVLRAGCALRLLPKASGTSWSTTAPMTAPWKSFPTTRTWRSFTKHGAAYMSR